MAKTIEIKLGKSFYSVAPVKVERSKLYGWSQLQAITPEGQLCSQGGINNDGITLVGPNSTKIGMLAADGQWIVRSELVALNGDGTEAAICPSTFDRGIQLDTKATVEELLDLTVEFVYQLNGDNQQTLANAIGDDIYRTTFSYRGGYEENVAFVIASSGQVFIVVGKSGEYDMIGILQEGVFDEDPDMDFDDEEIDFSMM